MDNLIVGIICLTYSLFIYFFSPKEGKNMLGYKSPQQGMHKNIWKWSNKCFGILVLLGSSIYLIITITMRFFNISKYNSIINRYGIIYIFLCIIITEIYTFVNSHKNR